MNLSEMCKTFVSLAKKVQAAEAEGRSFPSGPVTQSLVLRGNLILLGKEADAYMAALNAMSPNPAEESIWSRNTIDTAMTAALSTMLASDQDSVTSHREAVSEFQSTFSTAPTEFSFDLAIFGLDPACEGLSFGIISFARGTYTSSQDLGLPLRNGQAVEVAIARVAVSAIDIESAQRRAEQIVDRHIAVLNALLSEGVPSYVRFSRSFIGTRSTRLSCLSAYGIFHAQDELALRLYGSEEFTERLNKYGIPRASELLRTPGSLASRILAAHETAGAACIETQEREAFLLFAIALESVVLGNNVQQELSYQLALRIAHLTSSKSKDRKELVGRVKRLYALRSRIVHSGSRSVTKTDVEEIRYMCLVVLFELGRLNVSTSEDLESWFEERMLGGQEGPTTDEAISNTATLDEGTEE